MELPQPQQSLPPEFLYRPGIPLEPHAWYWLPKRGVYPTPRVGHSLTFVIEAVSSPALSSPQALRALELRTAPGQTSSAPTTSETEKAMEMESEMIPESSLQTQEEALHSQRNSDSSTKMFTSPLHPQLQSLELPLPLDGSFSAAQASANLARSLGPQESQPSNSEMNCTPCETCSSETPSAPLVSPPSALGIYLFGGADPSGTCGDYYYLDLLKPQWRRLGASSLVARYEHVAFSPAISVPPSLSSPQATSELLGTREIFLFGGASTEGNLDNLVRFDSRKNEFAQIYAISAARESVQLDKGKSTSLPTKPSPRTHHSCAAFGTCFYVFAGGELGSTPVDDPPGVVYCFESTSCTWRVLQPAASSGGSPSKGSGRSGSGSRPRARQGHLLLAMSSAASGTVVASELSHELTLHQSNSDSQAVQASTTFRSEANEQSAGACSDQDVTLVLHGGLSGEHFFDDLWLFHVRSSTWSQVRTTRGEHASLNRPVARAAHAGVALDPYARPDCQVPSLSKNSVPDGENSHSTPGKFFVFGGLSEGQQVLNDLHCFSFNTRQWTEIRASGTLPLPRLDLGCSLVWLPSTPRIAQQPSTTTSDPSATTTSSSNSTDSHTAASFTPALLVHGGMDLAGEFFDDAFLCSLI